MVSQKLKEKIKELCVILTWTYCTLLQIIAHISYDHLRNFIITQSDSPLVRHLTFQ